MSWWRRKSRGERPAEPGERRQFPRARRDVSLTVAPIEGGPSMGLSVDVSEGGIRLQAIGIPLEAGQAVEVTITAGRDTRVLRGTVMRAEELDGHSREVAVAFAELDDDTRRFLRDHVLES